MDMDNLENHGKQLQMGAMDFKIFSSNVDSKFLYFGDNIPSGDKPLERWELDNWRVRLNMARLFVDAVNRHGGNATLIHLPEVGIYGNDHFLFADRNNVELADLLSDWLRENQLD